MRLIGPCPTNRAHLSTPYAVLIHNHALAPMSCDVFVHVQCNYAIAYLYHATYKMRTICAHILMHIYPCNIWTFILKCIQIPNHDIQHSTYQVQACTCILTKFLNISWIIIIDTYISPPCTIHVNTSYNIH